MAGLFDLTGRIALVTGGTKGMGLAMSQALAEHGATVLVSSRSQEASDEAAAKLRVALYTLPPDLKEMKQEIDQMAMDEEEAHTVRDYERAAQHRAERLRLETEFAERHAEWQADHQLDETVDANDIAEVVAKWTGIPVTQMMETGANDVLVVDANAKDAFDKSDRLIPYIQDDVILSVNKEQNTITVDWDPGF